MANEIFSLMLVFLKKLFIRMYDDGKQACLLTSAGTLGEGLRKLPDGEDQYIPFR